MNIQQAQAAVEVAKKQVQDASSRRTAQAVIVRDLEGQMGRLTSASGLDEAADVAARLNVARAILSACDRELDTARQQRAQCDQALRATKERVAILAHKIAAAESGAVQLNRDLKEVRQRVSVIEGGLDSAAREIKTLKAQYAELTVEAVQHA